MRWAGTGLVLSALITGCSWPGATTSAGELAPGSLAFGSEVRIGRTQANPSSPFLRAGADGRLYMVWTEQDSAVMPAAQAAAGAPSSHEHSGHAAPPSAAGTPAAGTAAAAGAKIPVRLRSAFMAMSGDGGSTWSAPERVNSEPEDVQGDENLPKLVIGPDGRVLAAWSVPNAKGDKMRGNIRIAFRTAGAAFSPARNLNEVADAARFVSLEPAPDGTVFAAWIDRRQDGPAPRQVYMSRIGADGTVLGPNQMIYAGSCECCRTGVAFADGGNTVYMAYRSKPADNVRSMVVQKSADGGRTFAAPVLIRDDGWRIEACPHSGPVIGTDAQGHLHSAWYTYGAQPGAAGIYYAVSTDGGRTFAKQLVQGSSGNEILHPALVVAKDGTAYVTWDNLAAGTEQTQIFLRRLPAGSQEFGPVQQVSRAVGNAMRPHLAIAGDRLAVAWTEMKGESAWVNLRAAPILP